MSKQCNFCQNTLEENRKHYCEQCENCMYRECKACHKPYPSEKFFQINAERCNSCSKKKKKKKNVQVDKISDTTASTALEFPETVSKSATKDERIVVSPSPSTSTAGNVTIEEEIICEERNGNKGKRQEDDEIKSDGEGEEESEEEEGEEGEEEEEEEEEEGEEEEEENQAKQKGVKRKIAISKALPLPPKKKSKKDVFTQKELSLFEKLDDTKIKQQKKKSTVKEGKNLASNSKTLQEILNGNKKKRGPKAGAKKKPVGEKEKSTRAFINALISLKKNDPDFVFNGSFAL